MVSNLLVTIAICFYVANSESVQCKDRNSCNCQLPGLCQLHCTNVDNCKGSNFNLYCYPNYPCEIYCSGKSSCSEATIHNNNPTDVNLICSGADSCKGSSGILNCGTDTCVLNCVSNTACEDLGINTNNAKSFKCNGNCPINAPNEYTSRPTYTPTNNPITSPTMMSMDPTNIPTYNPLLNPTTTPTVAHSIVPSIALSSMPTLTTTYYPTITPTSNNTNFSIILQSECENDNIGECNVETFDTAENVFIDVSYWFSETVIYNLENMECFLYNIFTEWFDGLNNVNNITLCPISNVLGGIHTTNNSICHSKPCLMNINAHNNYEIYITIKITTANIETFYSVNDLKFRTMRKELQNIFMDTFSVYIDVTITLDYIGEEIKTPQLYDKSMDTESIIWIVVLILGIILCLIGCVAIYFAYRSCKVRHQSSKNVEIVKPRNRILSQSPLSIGSVKSQSKKIIEEDDANNCLDDRDMQCSSSDEIIDTNEDNSHGEHTVETDKNEMKADLRNHFNAAMNVMMYDMGVIYEENGENDAFIHQQEGIEKEKKDTLK